MLNKLTSWVKTYNEVAETKNPGILALSRDLVRRSEGPHQDSRGKTCDRNARQRSSWQLPWYRSGRPDARGNNRRDS